MERLDTYENGLGMLVHLWQDGDRYIVKDEFDETLKEFDNYDDADDWIFRKGYRI